MRQITADDIRLELDPESVRPSRKHGRRGQRVTELKRFFAFLGEERIGTIELAMQTFETRSKGKMYVNRRWESPRWKADLFDERYSRSYYETRKAAVEALVWSFNNRERRRAEEAAEAIEDHPQK